MKKNIRILLFPVIYVTAILLWSKVGVFFEFLFSNLARETNSFIEIYIKKKEIVENFLQESLYVLVYSWLFIFVVLLIFNIYLKNSLLKLSVRATILLHFLLLFWALLKI